MNELMDISSLSFEEIQEEYFKLKERCSQLIIASEQDSQRIHELRRSLDTATAAEAYLAQELEHLTSMQTLQDDGMLLKKQNEIDELKKRQTMLLTENEELHQDIADLRAENDSLRQKIKDISAESVPPEIAYRIPKEFLDLKDKLESENLELLAKLDETHESVIRFTMLLAEKEKHIEIFKDQVLCLEENLQSKREEVDEKSHLLESAQEQVVEMNAKIAMLTSSPDNTERKGNSLFAEVDDQRQAMKQLLAAQKKSYLQMKKIYNESQHEIRRLKRENVAMHNELQTCSTIFCSADKVYKEKLNERILQLLKQNEDLEKKLTFSQQELISMANDKGVVWLDSMLIFCKQETDEMKKQLHSMRIQKGILDEQLRNTQQELAKWRFEALKARCILIDRESLLTDNNIQFKLFLNKDVVISSNEMENAKPNIGFTTQNTQSIQDKTLVHSSPVQNEKVFTLQDKEVRIDNKIEIAAENTESVSSTEDSEFFKNVEIKKEQIDVTEIADQQLNIDIEEDCSLKSKYPQTIQEQKLLNNCTETKIEYTSLSSPNQENTKMIDSASFLCPKQESSDNKEDIIKIELKSSRMNNKASEDKENIFAVPLKTNVPKHDAKEILKESNKNSNALHPSILVTKKNIFDECSTKSVQFANIEPTLKSELTSEPKAISKPVRNKSSVIVRRILVGSKTKSESGARTAQN